MEDLNLLLFNKLREYDRFMRINRAPGALLSASNSDSMDVALDKYLYETDRFCFEIYGCLASEKCYP